jgi:hypothetical protein
MGVRDVQDRTGDDRWVRVGAVGPSSSAEYEVYTHFDHDLKVVALKHVEATSGGVYVRSCAGDGRGGVYAVGEYSVTTCGVEEV